MSEDPSSIYRPHDYVRQQQLLLLEAIYKMQTEQLGPQSNKRLLKNLYCLTILSMLNDNVFVMAKVCKEELALTLGQVNENLFDRAFIEVRAYALLGEWRGRALPRFPRQ